MRGTIRDSAYALTAAAIACCAGLARAQAQPSTTAPAAAVVDGRDFAARNLPAEPHPGEIAFRAARAWAWKEGGADRLFLERDVFVTLGVYQFTARRAVVWLEPVLVGGRSGEQVAVYLDGVQSVPGAAPVQHTAERLLVTGLILDPEPSLRADLLQRGRPDEPLIVAGEQRFAEFLAGLAPAPGAHAHAPSPRPGQRPDDGPGTTWPTPDEPDPRGQLQPAPRSRIDPPAEGVVTPSAGSIEFVAPARDQADASGGAIVLTSGVAITYVRSRELAGGSDESLDTVELTSQRAVVFLTPRADAGQVSYDLGSVAGIYLEGDVVVASGQYTLRGARMYYDIATERAIVLDAVFWTFDPDRGMPLYLRADAIRQESAAQWSAQNVRLANVGFAKPHFSIGATEVTITRVPADEEIGEPSRQLVDAKGVKFLAGDFPLTFAPRVRGEFRPSPIRRFDVGSQHGDPVVRTGWDIYTLAGLDPAPGNSATLLADGYFGRGPAVGADVDWRAPGIVGNLFGYYIYDNGQDHLPSGSEIDHDDDHRGMFEASQVWRLNDEWTLFSEFAWISDETFIPAFFRKEAETRREYISSLYARYLDDQSMFTVEVRGTLNDFVPNQYLLQSLGYQTQKTPEIAYYRVGDELFGGFIRYTGETRFSVMSLSFTEPTVRELGWRRPSKAEQAFGLLPGQSIGDALRAQGLDEDTVLRFDTRHEFEAPLEAGPINLTPFIVGRFTAWDTNFQDFSGDDGQDKERYWGAAGVRFGTSIQRVYNDVDSRALDIHRLRHIIEPNGAVWFADTTIEQNDLPVYDNDVESLADGFATRLGVRNTLQTMRGGEGRWRSVNWLTIDTDFVFSEHTPRQESPFGRFIDARPEHSILGDFLSNHAQLQLTDALAVTNNLIYSFDEDRVERTTIGMLIDHGSGFSTFVEYRELRPLDERFLDVGAEYELTRKYEAALIGIFDIDRDEIQTVGARLTRRFPQWTVDFTFGVDSISDDVSFGVSLRPAGIGAERRTHILTRAPQDDPLFHSIAPRRDRLNYGPFADTP